MPGKNGIKGYCKAMAALPGTSSEIAARIGTSKSGTALLMRRLAAVGLVRSETYKTARNGRPAVVWAVDGQHEAPKAKPGVTHIMFGEMVRSMHRGASTFDIAEYSGCHYQVAQYVVREAHRLGLCHIAEWTRSGVNYQPVYEWGKGTDAPKPLAMTPHEKYRCCVERQKALFFVRALAGVAA